MSILKKIEHTLFPCMKKFDALMDDQKVKQQVAKRFESNKHKIVEAINGRTPKGI